MYHVCAQGVDERMINVHYYYYWLPSLLTNGSQTLSVLSDEAKLLTMLLQTHASTECVQQDRILPPGLFQVVILRQKLAPVFLSVSWGPSGKRSIEVKALSEGWGTSGWRIVEG